VGERVTVMEPLMLRLDPTVMSFMVEDIDTYGRNYNRSKQIELSTDPSGNAVM
jgi:hypothetical protein